MAFGTICTEAGLRVGEGAETSGAPRPAEGKGVRPVSTGAAGAAIGAVGGASCCGRGCAASDATRGAGAAAGAWVSLLPLRLPNTSVELQTYLHADFLRSFASSGVSRPERARLASARPVSTWAS